MNFSSSFLSLGIFHFKFSDIYPWIEIGIEANIFENHNTIQNISSGLVILKTMPKIDMNSTSWSEI